MCFSPTASFAASGLLGAVGVASVYKTREIKALPLAAIPLIFAIQQAIEGGLWESVGKSGANTLLFTYIFLFFALFWWPAYAPFTMYLVEPVRWRRWLFILFGAVGLGLGGYLYWSFLFEPRPALVVNYCIYYPYSVTHYILAGVLYLLVTVVAGLLSSRRSVRIFYLCAGSLAVVSLWFYFENFISVWCFFGALVSGLLYYLERLPSPKPARSPSI